MEFKTKAALPNGRIVQVFELKCILYAEEGQLGLMDARHDTR